MPEIFNILLRTQEVLHTFASVKHTNTPHAMSATTAAAVINLFSKDRPENRLVVGQCPAWVLTCAASRLQEREGYAQAVNCGAKLARLLGKGVAADTKLRAFVTANLVLIDSEMPFGWAGALKA